MRKLGEMGLLGITVPEEYGGLGMGFVSTMLACDYVSGGNGSLATAYGAHTESERFQPSFTEVRS